MVDQYSVGGYRIDLYFPKYKIAIECDEKSSHSCKRAVANDLSRQKFIEHTLNCTFVRYKPHMDKTAMAHVVNAIFRVIKTHKE